MSAHSKTGASSMYRWSACPGSVRESAKVPAYTTGYAEEGTEAHDLAAAFLRVFLSGNDGADVWEAQLRSKDVDAEMLEAVNTYTSFVEGQVDIAKNDALLVEHRFDLSSVYRGCFGTADAVIYKPWEKLLIVVDYKHGAGVPVEVEGNPQLDYYALGALLTCGFLVNKVRKVIVQPRCPHKDGPVRASKDIDAIDLLDFRADLIRYAKATEDANAPLVSGDHCRFCPAAGVCPELHAATTRAAMVEFKPALPYDPAALARALGMRDAVRAWLKNVDEFAYREAEAGRFTGYGWKLVAKRATRSWSSDGRASELLSDVGLTPEQIYEPRDVRSPAQIEALFPKKKLPSEVAALIKSESSGHTLVHESDPRPPVKAGAAQEFTPVIQP